MESFESYGPPALGLGPLRIWVHGRQFPEATDAWDGNWLNITALFNGQGASVVVTGAVLDTVSFLTFGQGLSRIHATLTGEARLESVEPNLLVLVGARGGAGRMRLRVEMTPDNVSQGHWFELDIDQSYLPAAIGQCESVVRAYPVRTGEARGA